MLVFRKLTRLGQALASVPLETYLNWGLVKGNVLTWGDHSHQPAIGMCFIANRILFQKLVIKLCWPLYMKHIWELFSGKHWVDALFLMAWTLSNYCKD